MPPDNCQPLLPNGRPLDEGSTLSEAHALAKRQKPQSAAIRAIRMESAFAENVDRPYNGHASADDGRGVFGRQLQPCRAQQER